MNKNRKLLVSFLETELYETPASELKKNFERGDQPKLFAIFDRCLAQANRRRAYKDAQRKEAQLRK